MITRVLILFCMGALNLGILPCETSSGSSHSSSGSSGSKLESTSSASSKVESKSDDLTSEFVLKNIFVTFRSHEHTASDYPKGPNITNIPETQSNLTQDGKNHAYSFGEYLKKNYSESLFSGQKINATDFYCKGTTTRRTRESAMLVEAGILENESKKSDPWSEEEGKKYIFNKTYQYTKFYNMSECPAFYKAVAESVKTEAFNTSVKDCMSAVDTVSRIYPNVTHRNPATVWLAYETFWSMKTQNISLNTNITDNVMEKLKRYAEQFIYTAESTNKSKKISGGVMVDGLLSKFEITNETEKQIMESSMRPMSLLAAPQGVLGAMIGAFSPEGTIYNKTNFTAETFYPGNGSYHILEYYEKGTGDDTEKFFKVLYTPNWTVPLMPLIYPGCNETSGICTQKQIQEALKYVRLKPEEQDTICKGKHWIDEIKDVVITVLGELFKTFTWFGQSRSN